MIEKAIAQINNPVITGIQGKEPEKLTGSLISGILGLLLVVAGLASFFYFLIGGIRWITSGGDKTAVESARQQILNALVGLIIVFSTWAVMSFIFKFLGMDFPNFKLPTLVGE